MLLFVISSVNLRMLHLQNHVGLEQLQLPNAYITSTSRLQFGKSVGRKFMIATLSSTMKNEHVSFCQTLLESCRMNAKSLTNRNCDIGGLRIKD